VSKMTIKQGTGTAKIDMRTTFDASGQALARAAAIQQGGKSISLAATFTATAAKLTIAAQGKTQNVSIPALPGLSTKDPSNWWFVKAKPKLGQRATYQSFNILSQKWQ